MKALLSFCLVFTLAATAGPEIGRPEARSHSCLLGLRGRVALEHRVQHLFLGMS